MKHLENCIIAVITCDEQMHSRCVLLLAQVLHSRGVRVCLALPDNSGAICLRLLVSSVLQRKASKRAVTEVTRPKGNDERGEKQRRATRKSLIMFTLQRLSLETKLSPLDWQRAMVCVVHNTWTSPNL